MALAVIAAFGVFGPTVVSGQSLQADLPLPGWLAGWGLCAVPLAGLFGLVVPTRARITRVTLSGALLIPGLAVLAVMSEPYTREQTAAATAMLACLLVWAIASTLVAALSRGGEVVLRLRRTVMWAGPATLAIGLAATML